GGRARSRVQHVTGRARLSGIETELRYAAVYTLRDGTIIGIREYGDREKALKAVGLVQRRSAVLPAAGTAALAWSRRLGVPITEAYPSVAAAFTSLREPSHGL